MNSITVYYDENCNLCQRMKRLFQSLQKGNPSIEWKHYLHAPACGIHDYACGESMAVELGEGQIYRGFFAVRILVRFTRLWFLTPLFYLPGMSHFGQKAYQWVVRNRNRW